MCRGRRLLGDPLKGWGGANRAEVCYGVETWERGKLPFGGCDGCNSMAGERLVPDGCNPKGIAAGGTAREVRKCELGGGAW